MISTFTAFFDANVFYGARLRSLIVQLAQSGTFRARWSEQIHDEWMRSLIKNKPSLSLESLEKTRRAMDRAVPDCLVSGYEPLVPSLVLPDENDRHVLAAAINVGADVIVTFNLKDFPDDVLVPYGIDTRSPDDFILDLESLHPTVLFDAVMADRLHYQNPALTIDEYLDDLRKSGLQRTADFLNEIRILLDREGGA
jgi:predicted nucleic acid-binding protein